MKAMMMKRWKRRRTSRLAAKMTTMKRRWCWLWRWNWGGVVATDNGVVVTAGAMTTRSLDGEDGDVGVLKVVLLATAMLGLLMKIGLLQNRYANCFSFVDLSFFPSFFFFFFSLIWFSAASSLLFFLWSLQMWQRCWGIGDSWFWKKGFGQRFCGDLRLWLMIFFLIKRD